VSRPDKATCKGKVWVKGMSFARQTACQNRAKYGGFCGIHSSGAVARRKDKKVARTQAKMTGWNREALILSLGLAVLALSPPERAALPHSIRDILGEES
jgi:hypothetical protein